MPVDVAAVTAGILGRARVAAESAEGEIVSDLAPASVPGDPLLLSQLVENLVSNAIRYNQAGGQVVVAVSVVPGRCQLTVSNTGERIEADAVAELFEPFRRLGP